MPPTTRARPQPVPEVVPPLPAQLLTGPRAFAAALARTEARPWRYLAPVLLSAVLSGVAYHLVMRHVGAPGLAMTLTNVLGSAFVTGLAYALLAGLGHLGAGQAGRAPEVYGASFTLLPPLYLLCIVWALLTPAPAPLPDPDATRAALRAVAATPPALVLILNGLLGTAVQVGLAFPTLRHLTGQPGRALLGAGLPLLPALAAQFLAVAPLALAR